MPTTPMTDANKEGRARCADCGTVLTDEEARAMIVCKRCWDRLYADTTDGTEVFSRLVSRE